jgi:hypothetical protein
VKKSGIRRGGRHRDGGESETPFSQVHVFSPLLK